MAKLFSKSSFLILMLFSFLITAQIKKLSAIKFSFDNSQYSIQVNSNDKKYSFECIEFIGYEYSKLLSNDNKLILFFSHNSGSSIIAECNYDEENKMLYLEDLIGKFPSKNDFDGQSKLCKLEKLKIRFTDIDEELIFEDLTENMNCKFIYEDLDTFNSIYKRIKIETKKNIFFLSNYGKDVNRYKQYFAKYPLNNKTLSKYNDIGYYLQESKNYNEAIYVLTKILKKYPNRAVAWLNLADASWGLGEKMKAKESYKKYLLLMQSHKKDLKKVPKRVYERVKQ